MMKKIALIAICLLNTLSAVDRLELWAGTRISGKITEKTSFSIYQERDYNEFVNDFYFSILDTSVTFQANKHLSVSPSFVTSYIKLSGSRWIHERTPSFSINYNFPQKGYDLYGGIRMYYRTFELLKNRGVLMVKAGIGLPIKDRIRLYIHNDLRYNYNGLKQFDENRIIIGYTAKLGKNMGVEFYYVYEDSKEESSSAPNGAWTTTSAIGIAINASF